MKDAEAIASNVRFKNTGENPTDFNRKPGRELSIKLDNKSDEIDAAGATLASKTTIKLSREILITGTRTAGTLVDSRDDKGTGVSAITDLPIGYRYTERCK